MVLLFSDFNGGEGGEASDAASGGGVAGLRRRIGEAGASVLGELNSRPKKLLHVTVGRLLDWPYDLLDEATASAASRVAARWASALSRGELPLAAAPRAGGRDARRAETPQSLPGLGEAMTLGEIELVRDTRWMMVERETLRTFPLRKVSAPPRRGHATGGPSGPAKQHTAQSSARSLANVLARGGTRPGYGHDRADH